MNTYIERIQKIAELENITISRLETLIGASKNVLHNPIKKNTDIGAQWIVKISEIFPHYNYDWIVTGRGEMFASKEEEIIEESELNQFCKKLDKEEKLLRIIESQQKTIENLSVIIQDNI